MTAARRRQKAAFPPTGTSTAAKLPPVGGAGHPPLPINQPTDNTERAPVSLDVTVRAI
jgi:hypothetical protein